MVNNKLLFSLILCAGMIVCNFGRDIQNTSLSSPLPDQGNHSTSPVISAENINNLKIVQQFGDGIILGETISPDGKTIAIFRSTGIYLFDKNTFEQIQYINHPVVNPSDSYTGPYENIVYSPNGKFLVFGNQDVIIWDLVNNKEFGHIQNTGGDSSIRQIQISPEGDAILVNYVFIYSAIDGQTGSGMFTLFDFTSGKTISSTVYYSSDQSAFSTFLSSNALFIFDQTYSGVSGNTVSSIKIINADNGNIINQFSTTGMISSVNTDGSSFSQFFDISSDISKTYIISTSNQKITQSFDGFFAFLPDSKGRALLHKSSAWSLIDKKGNTVCNFQNFPEFRFDSFRSLFNIIGDELIFWNESKQAVEIWSLQDCKINQSRIFSNPGNFLSLSGDDKTLVSTNNNLLFDLWDTSTGKLIATISPEKEFAGFSSKYPINENDPTEIIYRASTGIQTILFYRFYPNLEYFIWDIPSNKVVRFGETTPGFPYTPLLSGNGRYILYNQDGTNIILLDSMTNSEILKIATPPLEYVDFRFIDGNHFLVHNSTSIMSFNLRGEMTNRVPIESSDGLFAVSINNKKGMTSTFDGYFLTSLNGDIKYQLEDLPFYIEGYGVPRLLDFLNSDLVMACQGFEKNYLRFWNSNSGQLVREIPISFPIDDLKLSNDGTTIYTSSQGVVYIWKIDNSAN
jgi:hypothetical protein